MEFVSFKAKERSIEEGRNFNEDSSHRLRVRWILDAGSLAVSADFPQLRQLGRLRPRSRACPGRRWEPLRDSTWVAPGHSWGDPTVQWLGLQDPPQRLAGDALLLRHRHLQRLALWSDPGHRRKPLRDNKL